MSPSPEELLPKKGVASRRRSPFMAAWAIWSTTATTPDGLGVNFQHYTALMGADRAFATRYNPGYGNDATSSFLGYGDPFGRFAYLSVEYTLH